MPKVKMSTADYAKKRGISIQAVNKAIAVQKEKGTPVPHVTKVEQFGRYYVVTVTVDEAGNLA